MQNHQDLTQEFELLRDWYYKSDFQMVPTKDWVHEPTNKEDRVLVEFMGFQVARAYRNMIPAFAAISLGVSVEKLSEIIAHHDITVSQITSIKVRDSGKTTSTAHDLSQWNLTHSLSQAYFHDPERALNFEVYPSAFFESHESQVAALLLPVEALWPVTKINQYLKERSADPEKFEPTPWKVQPTGFETGRLDLRYFEHDEIITMIERSGNLIPEEDPEHWYVKDFFKNVLSSLLFNDAKNHHKMCLAICAAEDPDMLEKLNRKIISELSICDFQTPIQAINMLVGIEKGMPKEKFSAISQDILVNINLLEFFEEGVNPSQESEYDHPYRVAWRLKRSETLEALCQDLMRLEPHEFKAQHFKALHKVSDGFLPAHSASNIDLNSLLAHVLNGFEAYRNRGGNAKARDEWTERSEDRLLTFVKLVNSRCQPDYEMMNQLASYTQGILAKNGYDVLRMKGLNRRDRGHVLEDGMGL